MLWLFEPKCLWALVWTLGTPEEAVLTMLDLRMTFKTGNT